MKTLGRALTIGLFILFSTTPSFAMCVKSYAVSGGENHTLVLTENELVFSCGSNGWKQLGNEGAGSFESVLILVDDGDMNTLSNMLEDITVISAGWTHSLSCDKYGFAWAWGDDSYGQLGDSLDVSSSPIPVQVKSGEQDPADPDTILQDIVAIAAGRSGKHSLAADKFGLAWSWGINYYGQLGNGQSGQYEKEFIPVAIHAGRQDPNDPNSPLQNIVAVSAGAYHSMALEDPNQSAHVYTFGHNYYGQLGTGNTYGQTKPMLVLSGQQNLGTYLKHIVAVSAGWDHCLALEDPNQGSHVLAWGRNTGLEISGYIGSGGQLGNNSETDQTSPVYVLSGEQDPANENTYLQDIVVISAGEDHSIALDKDGFVWTWGGNQDGQLGIGETGLDNKLTPVKVHGGEMETEYLQNITAISAGYWHCLAIDTEGILWSWGKGWSGRLGTGNIDHQNLPKRIGIIYSS